MFLNCSWIFISKIAGHPDEWLKFFYGVLIFWVSNQKNNLDIGQKPYWISLLFFTLNYKHWKSQPSVTVFCWKRCSWKWLSVKLPAANKCNCRWYGLMFIIGNIMHYSQVWSQNWLRQTCKVFVFTFIKHLFKWRDVLHTGWLVEKKW